MTIQSDVGEILVYKKNATGTYGSLPGATGGQKLRYIDHGFNLDKTQLQPREKRSDYQKPTPRHGMRSAPGSISGQLSPGTYADFIGSAVRKDFAAVAALSALTDVTASASAPHFARASGSFITDGLRAGMVVRCTGWTTTGLGNNSKNFTILSISADGTGLTVAEAVAAKAAGDSVVFTVPGKVTYVPSSGHTNDDYCVESWLPDASLSRRYLGQRVSSFELDCPPDDYASVNIGFVGQDAQRETTAYFSSPADETTSGLLSTVTGAVFVNGVAQTVLTGFRLSVNGNHSGGKVAFSNVTPDVFPGDVVVSGSASVYLENATLYGYYDDEVEISIIFRLDSSEAVNCDFVAGVIAKATITKGSIAKDTNAKTMSFDWTAGRGIGTNGFRDTTVQFQDSVA